MRQTIITLLILLISCKALLAQTVSPTSSNEVSYQYTAKKLNINTNASIFSPTFYKDGVVFCKTRSKDIKEGFFPVGSNTNLYYAERMPDNSLKTPQRLKLKGTGNFDLGAVAFVPNKNLIYYTREKSRKSKTLPTWGIFSARMDGKLEVAEGKRFPHNFLQFDVLHPAISPDNTRLYFASDKADGYGGLDIYVCHRIGNSWSRPENLGPEINSSGHDAYPAVCADGTLYFASNGHNGMGGMDIYQTKQSPEGRWVAPKNLGAPINSQYDDFGMLMHEDLEEGGYFSSNRNQRNVEMYSFTAKVQKHHKGLTQNDPEISTGSSSNLQHRLMIARTVNMFSQDDSRAILNNVAGMDKVYFEPNKSTLPDVAKAQLNRLATYLKLHPAINIEIGAHTDARLPDKESFLLTQRRAEAAKNHLVSKQISPNRIDAIAYGESRLLNKCLNGMHCTEDLHEINNRLEIRAIEDEMIASKWKYQKLTSTPSIEPVAGASTRNRNVAKTKPVTKQTHAQEEVLATVDVSSKKTTKKNKPIKTKKQEKPTKVVSKDKRSNKDKMIAEKQAKKSKMVRNSTTKPKKVVTGTIPKNTQSEITLAPVSYKVNVGPLKQVDKRTMYELKQIDEHLETKNTPKGKMLILGPYNSEKEAEASKAKIEDSGLTKARISSVQPVSNYKSDAIDENAARYQLYIGPFRHVDNETYHHYQKMYEHLKINHTTMGTMIIMGPFPNMAQAKAYIPQVQNQSSKKTKIYLYKDNTIQGKAYKGKQRSSFVKKSSR